VGGRSNTLNPLSPLAPDECGAGWMRRLPTKSHLKFQHSLLHISRLIDRMCLGLAFNSCFSSTRVVYDLLDAFSLLLLAWMIVGRFVLGTHSISAVTVMVEKTEEVKTRRENQGM